MKTDNRTASCTLIDRKLLSRVGAHEGRKSGSETGRKGVNTDPLAMGELDGVGEVDGLQRFSGIDERLEDVVQGRFRRATQILDEG